MEGLGPLANQIKELYVPSGVAAWPPAPGWWVLMGLAVLALVTALVFWWRKTALRREAMSEIRRIETAYQSNSNGAALASDLSILLKRIALAHKPRDQVAGLTGEDWLRFLDRGLGDLSFSQGVGQVLKEGPYAPRCEIDAANLIKLVRRWIRRVA